MSFLASYPLKVFSNGLYMYTLLTDCMDGQLEQGEQYLFQRQIGFQDPPRHAIVAAFVTTAGTGEEEGYYRCHSVVREFSRDADGEIRLKARDLETPDICRPDAHGDHSVGITIFGTLYSFKPARQMVSVSLKGNANQTPAANQGRSFSPEQVGA